MAEKRPFEAYRRISGGRFRENVGLGYDELSVGIVIEHRPGRTVTEADHLLMTTLTGNVNPIHLDYHYSEQGMWGKPLVCAFVTLGIASGMTVRSTSGLSVANLGVNNVRFEHPVFIGDTIYAETVIVEKRVSNSRPEYGLITGRTSGFNQSGERVVEFTRTFLLPLDPDTVRDSIHY